MFKTVGRKHTAWVMFGNGWGAYVARAPDQTYNLAVLKFSGPSLEESEIALDTPVCEICLRGQSAEQIGRALL